MGAGWTLACAAPSRPVTTPSPLTPTPGVDWAPVTHALDSAILDGAAPGAVLGVSAPGLRFFYGTGRLGQADATRPDSTTVYDLASLTKVIGLTTLTMQAVSQGLIELDSP